MKKDKKCIKGVIQYERNHGNQAERYRGETGSSLWARILDFLTKNINFIHQNVFA